MITTIELSLEVPSSISKDEIQTLLALTLYQSDRLSLGQAAHVAGFSKRAFIEVLGHYKVPVFNYSAEDLREELGL